MNFDYIHLSPNFFQVYSVSLQNQGTSNSYYNIILKNYNRETNKNQT